MTVTSSRVGVVEMEIYRLLKAILEAKSAETYMENLFSYRGARMGIDLSG